MIRHQLNIDIVTDSGALDLHVSVIGLRLTLSPNSNHLQQGNKHSRHFVWFSLFGKIGAACCFLMSTATAEDEDIKRLELNKVPGNVYDTMTNNLEMRSTILGAFTFSYRLLMSGIGRAHV